MRRSSGIGRLTLWAPLTNAALGLWLIASPFASVCSIRSPRPSRRRSATRSRRPKSATPGSASARSLSGLLILVFALAGMSRRRQWVQWITATVGVWVLFAPLVFWTTSAAAYAVDTLIGMLVVAFAVMIPPTPGISRRALAADDDRPLGWSYSPSSFTQRIPIVALAFVGLFVSRYLGRLSARPHRRPVGPFFGPGGAPADNGSEAVVTSWRFERLSRSRMPGFGAFAYALDILAGAIGDRRRWRTMPWMVLLFGLLIIPLGVVSVSFIIIQPPIIGALCTPVHHPGRGTVMLVPYSIDEVLATCQYLYRANRAGEPFWRTFWRGGPALSEDQTPEPRPRPLRRWRSLREFVTGGVNFPWTLVASTALGAFLMSTPLVFGTEPPLYFSDHILGCLVITGRGHRHGRDRPPVRFLNVAFGVWIAVSPFVLVAHASPARLAMLSIGLR